MPCQIKWAKSLILPVRPQKIRKIRSFLPKFPFCAPILLNRHILLTQIVSIGIEIYRDIMDHGENHSRTELFVELLTAHQGRIRKFILSLVPNFADAEDIMQETSRAMWSQFDSFKEGTDFLAWSFKIAHYRILEFRRTKKRGVYFNTELLEKITEEASQRRSSLNKIVPHLYRCIDKLAASDRMILRLKYEENLKTKEISARIGKSCHTLYKHIAKIYEWLLLCVNRSVFSEEA